MLLEEPLPCLCLRTCLPLPIVNLWWSFYSSFFSNVRSSWNIIVQGPMYRTGPVFFYFELMSTCWLGLSRPNLCFHFQQLNDDPWQKKNHHKKVGKIYLQKQEMNFGRKNGENITSFMNYKLFETFILKYKEKLVIFPFWLYMRGKKIKEVIHTICLYHVMCSCLCARYVGHLD